MNIWIIRDGEKIGPIHDFEIRRKIDTGELDATTMAWHEGLATWKPLVEIGIFTRDLEEPSPQLEAAPSATPFSLPPPLPQPTAYIRRFWARWLDMSLYSSFWWLGMWAVGQDIKGVLLSPWLIFFRFVPWFLMEAMLLHYFGTTLGKWLLGLSVTNQDGSRLDLSAATWRSLRVMITGVGFGWGPLALFCQALSLFSAKRLGATFWDHIGRHRVMVAPLDPFRLMALVFLFALAMFLEMIVISPYIPQVNSKIFPSLKENPFWHLPKRS
jgi:uncharacterized RDD family membrane protein YckC